MYTVHCADMLIDTIHIKCITWLWNCAWCTVSINEQEYFVSVWHATESTQHIGDYKNRSVLSTERRQKPKDTQTHILYSHTENIHIYMLKMLTKRELVLLLRLLDVGMCVFVCCEFCVPISSRTLFHPLILCIHIFTHIQRERHTNMQTTPHNATQFKRREKKNERTNERTNAQSHFALKKH